jgi:hypothetical protein
MKSSILALILAAGLSAPALAQQPASSDARLNAHHPQQAQMAPSTDAPQAPMGSMPAQQDATPGSQSGPAGSDSQRPSGMMPAMPSGMMGQGGQRPGGMMSGMSQNMMMNCPMMRGGMAGMGQGTMQMGQPRGDQGVASLAMNAVNERMHREMALEYTGNVDADFVRNMIAHHQGAVDMARIQVAFGKDPKIRELAENVIKAQESEITMMRSWLAQNARQ